MNGKWNRQILGLLQNKVKHEHKVLDYQLPKFYNHVEDDIRSDMFYGALQELQWDIGRWYFNQNDSSPIAKKVELQEHLTDEYPQETQVSMIAKIDFHYIPDLDSFTDHVERLLQAAFELGASSSVDTVLSDIKLSVIDKANKRILEDDK